MDARAANNSSYQWAYEPLPTELCEQIYRYCMPSFFSPRMLHFVVVQFTISPRTCTVSPGPALAENTRLIRNLLCSRRDLRMYGLHRYSDILPFAILPRTTPSQGKRSDKLIRRAKQGNIRFCAAMDHVYISDIYLPKRGDGCSLGSIRYDILPGFLDTVQNLTLSLNQMKQVFNNPHFLKRDMRRTDMREYWGTSYLRWNVLLGMFPNLKKLHFPAGRADSPVYPSLFASREVCDHAVWDESCGGCSEYAMGCWPISQGALDWGLEQSNIYVLDKLSTVYHDYVRGYLPEEIRGRCQVLPMVVLRLLDFSIYRNAPIEKLSDIDWRCWCFSMPPSESSSSDTYSNTESTTEVDSELRLDTGEGNEETLSVKATHEQHRRDERKLALEKALREGRLDLLWRAYEGPYDWWRDGTCNW